MNEEKQLNNVSKSCSRRFQPNLAKEDCCGDHRDASG